MNDKASRKTPIVAAIVLLVAAIAWCLNVLIYTNSGQKCVFYQNAERDYFCDFFMPRAVVDMPVPYVEMCASDWIEGNSVRRPDQCYPALANFWVGLFPENLTGAVLCTVIGVVVFIWGMVVFFRRTIPDKVLIATSIVCSSSPFLFAVGVGNLILYTVGFSFVFLAWYDSTSRWRKSVAALALAIAAVLKIVPVLLGVAYLGRGWSSRCRYAFASAIIAILLFFIPFCFCGGVDAISAWMENAQMNSSVSARENMFGLVGFVSELMGSFALDELPYYGWLILRIVSSGLGLVLLVSSCISGNNSWTRLGTIVIGMFFVPPTMKCYTVLYVIPVVISGMYHDNGKISKLSAVCCVSMCMLLQVPLFLGPLGSLNVCFADAASVDLAMILALSLCGGAKRGDAAHGS